MKAGSEDFANIWFPNIWGEHQMGTALNQPSNAITIIITIANCHHHHDLFKSVITIIKTI